MAFELKKADIIEDIQNLIIIYLHDPITGLARGQAGPLICLTAQEDDGKEADHQGAAPSKAEAHQAGAKSGVTAAGANASAQPTPDTDLNALKGDKNGKGNGKGYGECSHCGQWGTLGASVSNSLRKMAETQSDLGLNISLKRYWWP